MTSKPFSGGALAGLEGMMTVNDQMRIEAWLDSLPLDERARAEQLASLPPGLAVARSDRDLRVEMASGFARVERAVEQAVDKALASRTVPQGFGKKSQAALIIIGSAIVQAAVAAAHSINTSIK